MPPKISLLCIIFCGPSEENQPFFRNLGFETVRLRCTPARGRRTRSGSLCAPTLVNVERDRVDGERFGFALSGPLQPGLVDARGFGWGRDLRRWPQCILELRKRQDAASRFRRGAGESACPISIHFQSACVGNGPGGGAYNLKHGNRHDAPGVGRCAGRGRGVCG